MTEEDGFITVNAFFLFLAIGISFSGIYTAIYLLQNRVERERLFISDYETMLEETKAVIRLLDDTQDPGSDSMFDPVWEYISMKSAHYSVFTLADISSRLNPNWIRPVLFERTKLGELLLPGVSPDIFKEYRENTGFVMDIREKYGEVMEASSIEEYFTPYGYMNINTAYEFPVERMFAILTGDSAAADVFHTFIDDALSAGHLITEEELASAAGNHYVLISPVITTAPEMNVNFIPPFILDTILSYPYGGKKIENHKDIFAELLETRNREEITAEKLETAINAENLQRRVFQHLGTKTWFWKLNIAGTRTEAEAIITCIPVNVKLDRYVYRLYSFKTDHLKDTE